MITYYLEIGNFEGINENKAVLKDVYLNFETIKKNKDTIAVIMTGKFKFYEGDLSAEGQIHFKTTTSNFGVSKEVTITLNRCVMGNGYKFRADSNANGDVFTLLTT